ncbi:hypothetical protein ACQBAR_07050 [Propionibacteriaceae bacterium Y1685]|uniref:hypothetical protein n=1 Tax=Microlunatus sp. Y1700 TaxID=3418487 RepID=UPI003B7BE858
MGTNITATTAERPRMHACDAIPSSRALGVSSVISVPGAMPSTVMTEATLRVAQGAAASLLAPSFGDQGTSVTFGNRGGATHADFGKYDPRSGPSWSPPI